jgi:hypothetical protein
MIDDALVCGIPPSALGFKMMTDGISFKSVRFLKKRVAFWARL